MSSGPIEDVAYQLAKFGHGDTKRKDGVTPYINHPVDVVKLLKSWGVSDSETLAAAYDHDLLEDTDVSESDIKRIVSPSVLNKVKKLTHIKGTPKDEYIKKLSEDADIWCVVIKAADRICNTIDFLCMGKFEYAQKYFDKAKAFFSRLDRDKSKLGKVYQAYREDKHTVEDMLAGLNGMLYKH